MNYPECLIQACKLAQMEKERSEKPNKVASWRGYESTQQKHQETQNNQKTREG